MLKTKYDHLSKEELVAQLIKRDAERKLGLVWERDQIDHERSLNEDFVCLNFEPELSIGNQPFTNLLIEGDNFDALRYLSVAFNGRIKCIYIDPPYNTGNKDFIYNDRFVDKDDLYKHSKWLEFMYRRLLFARDLLAEDGAILVSINDENRAKLELLLDQIFPGKRLGSFVWRTKDTGNDAGQNFSQVHEHVLVYANPLFTFVGKNLNLKKYAYNDNDGQGNYCLNPITKAHTYLERPNTYYPLQDPETGYWYPCDPNSVWRFASESRIKPGQRIRTDTIEDLIRRKLIFFPKCKPDEVIVFSSKQILLEAIRNGSGPALPKKKTPLLREDLPDLDFWVGKPIAPGRPSRKSYLNLKQNLIAPVSSWIAGINEEIDHVYDEYDEELEYIRSSRGGEGTDIINEILGTKAFSYPKPPSLMRNLIRQATKNGGLVLDFFGGSGTTAQAVLELNLEDGLSRRFIIISSTEATESEHEKNVCRDVCARRIKGIIEGYRSTPGTGGDFAYMRTELIPFENVHLDIRHDQVWYAIQLINADCMLPFQEGMPYQKVEGRSAVIIYIPELSKAILDEVCSIANMAISSMLFYTWQPGYLSQSIYNEHVCIEQIPEYLIERFGGAQ